MRSLYGFIPALLLFALCLSLFGGIAAAEEAEGSLFVYDLPAGITEPCDQAGTVTEEHYATWRYDLDGNRGEPLIGTLYVYTPFGYDPEKQYDILYLMFISEASATGAPEETEISRLDLTEFKNKWREVNKNLVSH